MPSTIWMDELVRAMTPIQGLYPRETGYTYVDKMGTRISGTTLPDLISRVRRWRELNGLPVGDPTGDVHEYLCKRNPSYCRGAGAPPPPAPPNPNMRALSERVLAWLGRIGSAFKSPVRSVDTGVLASRMEACRACAYNKPYVAACRGCSATSLAVRRAWVTGPAASVSEGVHACAQYGYDAAVAAQLGPDKMPPDRHAPSGCWRRPDITG